MKLNNFYTRYAILIIFFFSISFEASGEQRIREDIIFTNKILSELPEKVNKITIVMKIQFTKDNVEHIIISTDEVKQEGKIETFKISRDQGLMMVGHLASDGLIYRGGINREKKLALPNCPFMYFALEINDEVFFEYIPISDKSYKWHWDTRPPVVEQMSKLLIFTKGQLKQRIEDVIIKCNGIIKAFNDHPLNHKNFQLIDEPQSQWSKGHIYHTQVMAYILKSEKERKLANEKLLEAGYGEGKQNYIYVTKQEVVVNGKVFPDFNKAKEYILNQKYEKILYTCDKETFPKIIPDNVKIDGVKLWLLDWMK